jgi:hypothetical protein
MHPIARMSRLIGPARRAAPPADSRPRRPFGEGDADSENFVVTRPNPVAKV